VPQVVGNPPDGLRLAWNERSGRPVVAHVLNASVIFSELDPSTGAELRHREVAFRQEEFSYLAEMQYRSEEDTAAMLLPGKGIALLNLSTGNVQRFFTGPENSSLAAMRYGGSWLAAIGSDWAGSVELPSGSATVFRASTVPGAFAGSPVAVDYDPAGRRLFTGRSSSSGTAFLSVVLVSNGSAAQFSKGNLPADLSSMRYLAGRDQLMFGLGQTWRNPPVDTMWVLDLANGTFLPFQAFSGGYLVGGLQVQGDGAAALATTNELLVVNLRDESYEIFPVELPYEQTVKSWAFDFEGERLLARTPGGELWLLDLKNGRGRPLATPGTVPARVSASRPAGNTILLGTEAGVVAVGPIGTQQWRVDCGAVSALALDPASHTLAAGASEDWSFDPALDSWRFSRLNITLMDLSSSPPSTRSWQIPSSSTGLASVSAMALDTMGGRLILGAGWGRTEEGLYALNLSTGGLQKFTPPAAPITSLALSLDRQRLFAGCNYGGVLVTELSTGAQQLLLPLNNSGLVSSDVSSLLVDEFGRLFVGQRGTAAYPGGLTVFSPDLYTSRSYFADSGSMPEYYDVHSIARDPGSGRIFLGLGSDDGLVVIDESSNNEFYVPGLFSGSGGKMTVQDLYWNPSDRTLLVSGGGLGFILQWADEHPQAVGLDVGADGTVDWTSPGRLDSALLPDLTAAVQESLVGAGGGPALRLVPLRLSSSSAGLLGIRSLLVTYEWSRCLDLRQPLASALALRPAAGNGTVALTLEASGGGLSLFNLSITYVDDSPPVARSVPEFNADAAARAPTVIDLGRFFTDDLTPPANLSYAIRTSKTPAGVEVSLLFSRYLLIDARNASYRGQVVVTVTASDSSGLTTAKELRVNIHRSNEYQPPPPAYNLFLWASAGVLLAVGLWIIMLFLRLRRAKKE